MPREAKGLASGSQILNSGSVASQRVVPGGLGFLSEQSSASFRVPFGTFN